MSQKSQGGFKHSTGKAACMAALLAVAGIGMHSAAYAADTKASDAKAAAPAAKKTAAKPAKRTKFPDWSGVWGHHGSLNFDPTVDSVSADVQPNAPLNAEYKQKYADYIAAIKAGKPRGDIGCLPEGMPRIMRSPYAMEVVITPGLVWIPLEFKREIRRVYTDGRKPMDPDPSYEGYSVGHWEGDTLVIDTTAIKAGTIDSRGLVHSDQLTVHERMRKSNAKTLEDQITLTDPVVFTQPFTVTRIYDLHKDWEVKEFVCEDNDRNPIGANGQTGIAIKK